jgi:hypothetical protein
MTDILRQFEIIGPIKNVVITMSTNDSAIKALTTRHNWYFAIYVVVLLLAAFLSWLVWKSGNELQELLRTDANTRVGIVETELAKQQERAANAERELEEIKERTRPRGLTEAQLLDLRQHLLAISDKIPIEIMVQDHSFPVTETSDLVGQQLVSAFRDAGFEVVLKHRPTVPPVGIHLDTLLKEMPPQYPPAMQPLIDFLKSAPFLSSARPVIDPAYAHITVRIVIGQDPMGR